MERIFVGNHAHWKNRGAMTSNEPTCQRYVLGRPFTTRRNKSNCAVRKAVYYDRHSSPTAVRLAVFRAVEPFVPDVPCQKDGSSVLRFPTLCWAERLQHSPKTEGTLLLHAILVDGMIERIEGNPELADAAVWKQRKAGHRSEYLFAARSEQEFERKRTLSPLLQRQCASAH